MAEERGAMFNEFVQGGLLDDVDVTIQSARFASWDYKGKFAPTLALRLELVDSEGTIHEDFLSSGELKFFVPSSDGKKAIPVGTAASLNLNTNAVAFILSVMNSDTRGELAAKMKATDDISVLDGLKFHMVRKDQPKRPGIVAPAPAAAPGAAPGAAPAAPERVKQRVECTKILAYPWEKGGTTATTVQAPTAGAPATQAAPTGNGSAGGPIFDEAAMVLMGLVAASGGALKKQMIAGKCFNDEAFKAKEVAARNGILGVIVKDEFLSSPAVTNLGLKYDPATTTVVFGS